MQPYKFKVKYEPGPKNIADPLSRLVGNQKTSSSHSSEAEEYIRFVAVNATPCAMTTREVEEALAIDEEHLRGQGMSKRKTMGAASLQKVPFMCWRTLCYWPTDTERNEDCCTKKA